MNPSKIDIDRNISKLRVNSSEFLDLEKANLISMLDQTIDNIKTISYYWATLASEKKGILNKSKEGEEWIGGPFACIYAIQYFKDTHVNDDGLDKSKYNDSKKSYKAFPTKNIETKNSITGTPDEMITSYDYRSCYENDLVSLVGGGQRWYGELFDIDLEQTFNFSVPNITDEPAHFNASIASNASSSAGTLQRYSVNGLVLEESSLPITTSDYARSERSFLMSSPPSAIPLKITIQRNSPNVLTYLD